ncbi:uncharacterized protein LOC116258931 [Nymphaea colorata]|nr:uncharacterized protein LOC116258931 [Nymphaea colorata]
MTNRKSKLNSGAAEDGLALVKAAAWAWYLHGSGKEGKPAREFDSWRTKQPPRPSRYKLEAMRDQLTDRSRLPSTSPRQDPPANSLLDPYEIQSISKRLTYALEDSIQDNCIFVDDDGLDGGRKMLTARNKQQRKAAERRRLKGWLGWGGAWMRHASAVCGPGEGVVETSLAAKGRTGEKGCFVVVSSAHL